MKTESAKTAAKNILALQQPWSTKLPYGSNCLYPSDVVNKYREEQHYAYRWLFKDKFKQLVEYALDIRIVRQIGQPTEYIWGLHDLRPLIYVTLNQCCHLVQSAAGLERFLKQLNQGISWTYRTGDLVYYRLVYCRKSDYGQVASKPVSGWVTAVVHIPKTIGDEHSYEIKACYMNGYPYHLEYMPASCLSLTYDPLEFIDEPLVEEMLETVVSWSEICEMAEPLLNLASIPQQKAFLDLAREAVKRFLAFHQKETGEHFGPITEETLYAFADELQTWYETP